MQQVVRAERPRQRHRVELEYPRVDGGRGTMEIAYFEAGRVEGSTDSGADTPLFVLVHGLATNADTWARVVEGLAERGRVLALDQPGCGWSEVPRDFTYDAPGLADVVGQFVRRAPELAGLPEARPVVLGHSLGGGLVTYAALHGWIQPRALVLTGPAGFPMRLPPFIASVRSPLGAGLLALSTLVPQTLLARRVYHKKEVLTPDLGAMLLAQRRDRERRWALHQIFKHAVDLRLAHEVSPRLGEIEPPVLVVWGEKDRVVPATHADRWREGLRHGRVEVLANCGHTVAEEEPHLLLELLDEERARW